MSAACVEMGYVDVASDTLDGEVGIAIEDGVVADVDAFLRSVLRGELSDEGCIVGCIVAGVVAHVGAQFYTQYFGDVENDVRVGVETDGGQGQYILVGGVLPGDFIVPVEDAEVQVLPEGCTEDLYAPALLAHFNVVCARF